ncbi:MAG: winged helix-turn-helix domain-containing protein, partial [Saccharofermentanales bacterium]
MKTNGMHLYQQIQDYILGMISRQELKPGDRLPSEHDLSEKMKVSRLTVRKAYVPLIEKGILSASQGKGTFVSDLSSYSLQELSKYSGKGLHSKKVVSVIFPEITVFFAPIIKVIEEVATKNNFTLNVMFNDSYDRELNAINTTIANKVDGVIITPIRNAL